MLMFFFIFLLWLVLLVINTQADLLIFINSRNKHSFILQYYNMYFSKLFRDQKIYLKIFEVKDLDFLTCEKLLI